MSFDFDLKKPDFLEFESGFEQWFGFCRTFCRLDSFQSSLCT